MSDSYQTKYSINEDFHCSAQQLSYPQLNPPGRVYGTFFHLFFYTRSTILHEALPPSDRRFRWVFLIKPEENIWNLLR